MRRILSCIKDPTTEALPAVLKATQLAAAFDAHLELFHAIDTATYVDMLGLGESDARRAARDSVDQYSQRLARVAARVRLHAPSVSVAAECDFPIHEAIIRRAIETHADLIVAERHVPPSAAPGLRQLLDWELVRLSPIPVLLVKTPRLYRRPAILAALDPARVFAKPADLDEDILQLATAMADALRGEVHAIHAYDPTPGRLSDVLGADARLDRAVQACHLLQVHRHVEAGTPCEAVCRVAREIRADIVVVGEMSRSGLQRALIGNTAEQLLNSVPCDLLVVKPGRFHCPVQLESRGTRVVTLLPLG